MTKRQKKIISTGAETPVPLPTTAKPYYKSKTMIVNGLLFVAGVIGVIAGELNSAQGLTLTLPAIINIVLRAVTKTGITTTS